MRTVWAVQSEMIQDRGDKLATYIMRTVTMIGSVRRHEMFVDLKLFPIVIVAAAPLPIISRSLSSDDLESNVSVDMAVSS